MESKYRNNNTLSKRRRELQLKYDAQRKYGLSLEKARELRKGNCEICGVHAKKMVIDHVVDGSYRGILCQQCNTRLGWYESRMVAIVMYLSEAREHMSK